MNTSESVFANIDTPELKLKGLSRLVIAFPLSVRKNMRAIFHT